MSNPKVPGAEKPDDTNERPIVTGDKGQDDAYATESNPEGLRYGEKPHKPGELPHPENDKDVRHDPPEPIISISNP